MSELDAAMKKKIRRTVVEIPKEISEGIDHKKEESSGGCDIDKSTVAYLQEQASEIKESLSIADKSEDIEYLKRELERARQIIYFIMYIDS